MLKDNEHRARVRWHCRRGMLELDVLLLNFFDNFYASLPENERQLFETLLHETDQDLFNWLVKQEQPHDIAFLEMIVKIRSSFANKK